MLRTLSIFFGLIPCILRSRRSLLLEILALRQQLAVLKTKHPQPRLAHLTGSSEWFLGNYGLDRKRLVVVQPETVIGWHRAGFKLYWT